MHMIEGFAEEIASRTMLHLSESPSPRTFQDKIERDRFENKLKLLILKQGLHHTNKKRKLNDTKHGKKSVQQVKPH